MSAQAAWAVARNTVAQAIRVRVAFVIMALYVVLVPTLPFFVRGDGTLRGLLHVAIGFSLIVAATLLGVLTLALSTTTLWTEIRDKQIFLLEARPIRRWEVLLGKLLGILIINAALLAFMGVVTWLNVRYLFGQKRWSKADRVIASKQVLIARRAVSPEPIAEDEIQAFVDRHVDEAVRALERRGKMPEGGRGAVRQTIREEYIKIINAVRPRGHRTWLFTGIRAARRPGASLTIRFKHFSSDRKSEDPDDIGWEIGPPGQRRLPVFAGYMPDEVHEIEIPMAVRLRDGTLWSTIGEDGKLEVRLYNLEPRRPTLIFPGEDAIAVLVPEGGFAANLTRGLALIFVEVFFIAVLGLFCSTFLGFPVSPIVALSLLLLIYLGGVVSSEFERGFTFDYTKQSETAKWAERATRAITTFVRVVLPPFDRYSPSSLVSSGEKVTWGLLLEATGLIGILHGGILTLLGAVIFQKREIALASR